MQTQITPDNKMDMTSEEKLAIAKVDNICQGILKEAEENEAMILKAEELLNSIPPEEFDKLLALSKSNVPTPIKQLINIIIKLRDKIK